MAVGCGHRTGCSLALKPWMWGRKKGSHFFSSQRGLRFVVGLFPTVLAELFPPPPGALQRQQRGEKSCYGQTMGLSRAGSSWRQQNQCLLLPALRKAGLIHSSPWRGWRGAGGGPGEVKAGSQGSPTLSHLHPFLFSPLPSPSLSPLSPPFMVGNG